MFRFLSGLLMGAFLAFCGWVMGPFYPAPAALTDFIQQRQVLLAHRLGGVNLQSLQGVLSPDQLHALQTQASDLAARAGQAILVEHVSDEDVRNVEAVSMTPVSMTLQTFAVLLAGAVLGPWRGAATVLRYLAMGAVGWPVFSAGAAGGAVLWGPAAG
jgi:hypothetical protein